MPKILQILPNFLVFCVVVSGCTSHESRRINRLDLSIADSTHTLTSEEQTVFDTWIEIVGNNATLDNYRSSKPFQTFGPMVSEQLPALDSVEQVLGIALDQLETNAKLYGLIIPYNQSVVTLPTKDVLIGLNHYLGSDNKIYNGFQSFLRPTKELKYLPAHVVEAVLAQEHPAAYGESHTLLNEMFYEGALAQSALETLPKGTSEAVILNMSEEDYEWCRQFESKIWNTMIERQLLYNNSESVINRLISPSPRSTAINAQAPGRAAVYMGLKIAQSYLKENPDKKAIDLLSQEYYNDHSSLVKSKFTPTKYAH